MTEKPVLVSGVKPTGDLHIGNYFGAMRQFVELTKEGKYHPFIFVADYHALNTMQNAEEMRQRTQELMMAYLAVGLDLSVIANASQKTVGDAGSPARTARDLKRAFFIDRNLQYFRGTLHDRGKVFDLIIVQPFDDPEA